MQRELHRYSLKSLSFHPLALNLKKEALFFRPPALISSDEVEIAGRKTPPCERPLLIAAERHQFLQEITVRDGGHDVGPGRGDNLLPRIAYLLEIELRGSDPARAIEALAARLIACNHARERLDLRAKSRAARHRCHEPMTPPVACHARLASLRLRARTLLFAFARLERILRALVMRHLRAWRQL